MVRGDRGDKRVDLYWEPVEGATGYNIYRKGEEEVFSLKPLNRELLVETQYTDLNVENEKKYLYSVRTLRRVVRLREWVFCEKGIFGKTNDGS